MTDKEIIKALECCAEGFKCRSTCPYIDEQDCTSRLFKDAVDLINRQQAEIERLQEAKNTYERVLKKTLAAIRTEATKDFAKRLREKSCILHFAEYPYRAVRVVSLCDVVALEKEMTEGQK